MNCPRCTHELPEESRFCPACGLDLEQVSESEEVVEESAPSEAGDIAAEVPEESGEGFWPQWLAIQSTRSPKKPALATTLAFFLGPFTYLYLEQMAWFWAGLIGGIVLSIMSRGELIPLLLIGGMLHSWDVARILNQRLQAREYEELPFIAAEEEGI